MKVFTVKKVNDRGERISKQYHNRLLSLGFKESKQGYYIDLNLIVDNYIIQEPIALAESA